MALFSRRKKHDDAVSVSARTGAARTDAARTGAARPDPASADASVTEAAPAVAISVQAFRGVGAEAGPEVSLPVAADAGAETPGVDTRPSRVAPPAQTAGPAIATAAPEGIATTEPPTPTLPLAPALPPTQTETVPGMKDNVLLREALAQIREGATNEHLIGVLRQCLQGHLYLRVQGDAQAQIAAGKPLSIGVARDGDRAFLLAFSSAGAVRASIEGDPERVPASAVAQPVTAVLQQVVGGDFTGMVLDNASGEHRAVFPTEVLRTALEQADPAMTVKSLLAAPRDSRSAALVGEALASVRTWVAVNDGSGGGGVGIAEARTSDGTRLLQLFSHPIEVVALGRGDRPLPFTPEQLAKVLSEHPEIGGVLVDAAGPSIIVDRSALTPVLVLAVDVTQ